MKIYFAICFIFLPLITFSQTDTATSLEASDSISPRLARNYASKSWGLVGGFHLQKSAYAEFGIGKAVYGFPHHPIFGSYALSTELYLGNDFIIAPKVSVLLAGGMALRLNAIYYTDLEKGSLRIRPDIGVGIGVFNLFYGYNIPITNKKFPNVNEHNFSIVFFISRKIIKGDFM